MHTPYYINTISIVLLKMTEHVKKKNTSNFQDKRKIAVNRKRF